MKKKKSMPNSRTLVSFDWAIKKLFRSKVKLEILEGFLSELLKRDIKITSVLESETNKDSDYDKQTRIDVLAQNEDGEIIAIEVQYISEVDYFHRILYGSSKIICDRIYEGMPYKDVAKVYSINIVYFDLGDGDDYIYHGTTLFRGLYKKDKLKLTTRQKRYFKKAEVSNIYPEYYLLMVSKFDNVAKDRFGEWMYYLKNMEIKEGFAAKGLKEADASLKYYGLSDEERRAYDRKVDYMRQEYSRFITSHLEGWEEGHDEGFAKGMEEGLEKGLEKGVAEGIEKGIEKGVAEGIEKGIEKGIAEGIEKGIEKGIAEGLEKGEIKAKKTIARNLLAQKIDIKFIVASTGLSEEEVKNL
jgi:predicted transposase/invertase (TIGR01784 family)